MDEHTGDGVWQPFQYAFISRNAYENQKMGISHLDLEMLKLTLEGLASRLRQQEARLLELERRLD